jgi:hypothetical protein
MYKHGKKPSQHEKNHPQVISRVISLQGVEPTTKKSHRQPKPWLNDDRDAK